MRPGPSAPSSGVPTPIVSIGSGGSSPSLNFSNNQLRAIEHNERLFGSEKAESYILLEAAGDEDLWGQVFEGLVVSISYGWDGQQAAPCAPMIITDSLIVSEPGRSDILLTCVQIWDILKLVAIVKDPNTFQSGTPLEEIRGDHAYNLESADLTLLDILKDIVKSAPPALSSSIILDDSDGIIDSYKPVVAVGANISALALFQLVLNMSLMGARHQADGIHLLRVRPDKSPDLTLDLDAPDGRTFFVRQQSSGITLPNSVAVVDRRPGQGAVPKYFGYAEDAQSSGRVGKLLHIEEDPNIINTAEAQQRANVLLRRLQDTERKGVVRFPMDCGLELLDKISIVDSRASPGAGSTGQSEGLVSSIIRRWKPGVYECEVALGGLTSPLALDRVSGNISSSLYDWTVREFRKLEDIVQRARRTVPPPPPAAVDPWADIRRRVRAPQPGTNLGGRPLVPPVPVPLPTPTPPQLNPAADLATPELPRAQPIGSNISSRPRSMTEDQASWMRVEHLASGLVACRGMMSPGEWIAALVNYGGKLASGASPSWSGDVVFYEDLPHREAIPQPFRGRVAVNKRGLIAVGELYPYGSHLNPDGILVPGVSQSWSEEISNDSATREAAIAADYPNLPVHFVLPLSEVWGKGDTAFRMGTMAWQDRAGNWYPELWIKKCGGNPFGTRDSIVLDVGEVRLGASDASAILRSGTDYMYLGCFGGFHPLPTNYDQGVVPNEDNLLHLGIDWSAWRDVYAYSYITLPPPVLDDVDDLVLIQQMAHSTPDLIKVPSGFIDQNKLIGLMAGAIRQLAARVDELEAKV